MDLCRVEMMLGPEGLAKIKKAKVAVIGLGGVGSYIAEALTRSGVGTVRIIDGDTVAPSNINRQLPALVSTMGKKKTDVVAARIKDINPECMVETVGEFYKPGAFSEFFPGEFDFIADAIDDVPAKIDIIFSCVQAAIPIISSMGTGNKLDPTKLLVADISATNTCPLARAVRKGLRQKGVTSGVQVVYSKETPNKLTKVSTPSSMVFVPASAGLLIASEIIRALVKGR
ncbi:MAG: tRNA threonylcarbamoyladenosine dehydratase [Acidaminococcaceae bacterium]